MLWDLITRCLLVPEVVLIMKTLIRESVSDPGSALYDTFQDRSWKISRSWCILFDQTLHCQPLTPAGIFGVHGGLLEVMLHLNSTSSIHSSRSDLTLWKKCLSFGRHGFPAALTGSNGDPVSHPTTLNLHVQWAPNNVLQKNGWPQVASLWRSLHVCSCTCYILSNKIFIFLAMGTFWLVPQLLFEGGMVCNMPLAKIRLLSSTS